jgi:hypothetical protein
MLAPTGVAYLLRALIIRMCALALILTLGNKRAHESYGDMGVHVCV